MIFYKENNEKMFNFGAILDKKNIIKIDSLTYIKGDNRNFEWLDGKVGENNYHTGR